MRKKPDYSGPLGLSQLFDEPSTNQDHVLAHKHSSNHRKELEESAVCGCFYCLAVFPPSEIEIWTDDGQTALCSRCPVDSVIGSASGYPITTEFLQRMHDYWFS